MGRAGALKATGNRGLQPAMDHILEHEGQPVPDISGVSESKGGSSAAMDVDEDDDDIEALKGLGVVKGAVAGGSSGADVEAKVRQCVEFRVIYVLILSSPPTEHQMFAVWQGI